MLKRSIVLLFIALFFLGMSPAYGKIDDYTRLLIESNTIQGSQVFTDASPSGHTVTPYGDVQHTIANPQLGSSAIYFDGAADYLNIPDSEDWNFRDEDFTIDFWMRSDAPTEYRYMMSHWVDGGGVKRSFGIATDYDEPGKIYVFFMNTSGEVHDYKIEMKSPETIVANTWYHVAVVREGNTAYLFLNGVLSATDTAAGGMLNNCPNVLTIGARDGGTGYYWQGALDEIRISKGIARWTSDFTPPAVPYSEGSGDTMVSLVPDVEHPVIGDSLCVDINIENAADLYAASFDLTYDPAALQYQEAFEGNFLNADNGATFFNASLLNDDPANGIVVIGVSRVADIGGLSGSGNIASACFTVAGGSGTNTGLSLVNTSFEGSEKGTTIDVVFDDSPQIPLEIGVPGNLTVSDPGTLNSLTLSWSGAPDASGYEVYRADSSGGNYKKIGTATDTNYQDGNCILTNVTYYYKVKAISAAGNSTGDFSNEASNKAAGISGDINKDNRVDGRDLTLLARAFNTSAGNADYDCLADLDRDGSVDGDDLIILTSESHTRIAGGLK